MEKTVSEAITYRRSVRIYKDQEIDSSKVEGCIINGSIAPTSSNLQLWEFYHITSKEILDKLAIACFNQNAAKTANQMVVFVSRQDLWRKRAKSNIDFLMKSFDKPHLDNRSLKRKKQVNKYYNKIIPLVYVDFFGILGFLKNLIFHLIGFFRPVYRQTRASDLRIIAHKSTALAAENFMISMAAIGYDTCPMEGFDSKMVKKILGLPNAVEITMIVSCGIRDEAGVYGERFRVPFKEVYYRL